MKSKDAHAVVFGVALAALVVGCWPAMLLAQTGIGESFEDSAVSWRTAGSDTRYRIEQHARVAENPHGGARCERISVTAGPGSFLHVSHDIGQPRVISELRPSVWVRADRAGTQLMARVVFPHTTDPQTRRPMTALVAGAAYTQAGRWQQLYVDDLSTLVARQVRVLRAQHGAAIDVREAHLDQLVLNIYSGRGATSVWIDDLEITGFVGERPGSREPEVARQDRSTREVSDARASDEAPQRRIELEGSVLLVEGRPFFPRVIDYRGEALERLKAMGFNAIWVADEPNAEVLEEARHAGMWVVCPPPREVADLGPRYDPVLAWDLGHRLGESKLAATIELAKRLRAADRRQPRILIASVDSQIRDYSRVADVLIFDRSAVGTTLEQADYVELLRSHTRFARPGTAFWCEVETQPAPVLAAQIVGLSSRKGDSLLWSTDQIRCAAVAALSGGTRGFWFRSYTRLDGQSEGARRRARQMEAVNLELGLIESWAAEGQAIDISGDGRAGMLTTALKSRKGQLLLISKPARGSQFATEVLDAAPANSSGLVAGADGRIIIPGVPEDDRPYDLTPANVRSLPHRRTAGGTGVTIDEPAVTRLIVCTHDPLLLSNLGKAIGTMRPRAAALAIELARGEVAETEEVSRRLGPGADLRWVEAARRMLGQAEQAHRARDFATAYQSAQRAAATCTAIRRAAWQRVAATVRSPVTSPLATGFGTLADHWLLGQHLTTLRPGENLLAAGDFEDLQEMQAAGWRHFRHAQDEVVSDVELSSSAPDSGRSCLAVYARPPDPRRAAPLLETAPVWITSPAAKVQPGSIVRISGRVRIPRPITASVDGLLVFDSLGGEPLALRLGETAAWQEFVLYRAALSHDKVSVTFALTGYGEAYIDRVSVEQLGASDTPAGGARRAP